MTTMHNISNTTFTIINTTAKKKNKDIISINLQNVQYHNTRGTKSSPTPSLPVT